MDVSVEVLVLARGIVISVSVVGLFFYHRVDIFVDFLSHEGVR
jgi:hypothetical protein